MPDLRPYQADLHTLVTSAWEHGARNVLMRLDTGGGKTIILAHIVQHHVGASAIIAHRHELVSQLSIALARAGVVHNVIAAQTTIRSIVQAHIRLTGKSWYAPGARCAVASVDTLIRAKNLDHWFPQVTLWIVDEGHHVVSDNKWATCVAKFTHPACRGLLPTATPSRADGKGLGAHADGVAHVMVQGPPMRWLIEQGYLTNYRMVCVESDVVRLMAEASVGSSGDYSTATLRDAAAKSHIVGDVVAEYLRWCKGMRDITFCPDTKTALEVTLAYQAAGVRAELLTGETDPGVRVQMLARFETGDIEQLVVVDIVSEGFDLPAVQSGAFARKTESLATYMQQFGRMLRPLYAPGYDLSTQAGRLAAIAASAKPVAWIRDHVNNFLRHGPPDRPRPWSLDRRDKRSSGPSEGVPMRICVGPGCFQPYERFRTECPYCGEPVPPPSARNSPAVVEGDLTELDAATLEALRGAVVAVDQTPLEKHLELAAAHVPAPGIARGVRLHRERQEAQQALRAAMAAWTRGRLAEGLSGREVHRLWWHTWGCDVLSAQALGTADARALTERLTAA